MILQPAILSESTVIMLMDLVGQTQQEMIVVFRILVDKGIVTKEEIESFREQVRGEVKPLRDQLLDLIEKAKKIQALEELESNEKTRPQ